MPTPLVSCILTVHDDARINLARKAINNFIRQHYAPYQLIVVNSCSQSVLTNDSMAEDIVLKSGCTSVECYAEPGLNASQMKNLGLTMAAGDWVMCIDDDDYFHPSRLLYQMAHRVDNAPCMLKYQLRLDISSALVNNENFVYAVQPLLHLQKIDSGIPCTMLFPRLNKEGQPWLFDPDIEINEYAELLARMLQHNANYVACDNMHNVFNNGLHWPLLSVAIYHGNNQLNYSQFFSDSANTPGHVSDVPEGINQNDIEHLKYILQMYNFKVS